MEVLPVGTQVKILGPEKIQRAVISSIIIYGNNNLCYEIKYWIDDKRETKNFDIYEIEVDESKIKKMKVGFIENA